MRVFIAISIVVASVSSASAQFAMDHGHAADAAQAARVARAAADAKAAATASGAPLLPSQQTNFYVSSGGTVKIAPRTAVDMKADATRPGRLERTLPADRGRRPRGPAAGEICRTRLPRSLPLQHRRELKPPAYLGGIERPAVNRWLPVDVKLRSELRWADGVHLDERSVVIVTQAMERALAAARTAK